MQLECRLAVPGSHAAVDETAGRMSRMQLSPEARPPLPLHSASACIILQTYPVNASCLVSSLDGPMATAQHLMEHGACRGQSKTS